MSSSLRSLLLMPSEAEMQLLGSDLATRLSKFRDRPITLYLEGDLGTGKTTLTRFILQSLGHRGAVKSPTYTLVEPYEFDDYRVYHFDLYRLNDADEFNYLGVEQYFLTAGNLCIVEWPNCAANYLPIADLELKLFDDCRRLPSDLQADADELLRKHKFVAWEQAGDYRLIHLQTQSQEMQAVIQSILDSYANRMDCRYA